MCYGLCQAEITVYIVAQTVPLLRVLHFKKKKATSSSNSNRNNNDNSSTKMTTSIAEMSPRSKGKIPGIITTTEQQPSIELVQLPSGRIVAADSEEGKQFQASSPSAPPRSGGNTSAVVDSVTTQVKPEVETTIGTGLRQRDSAHSVEDEVHRLWADMYVSPPSHLSGSLPTLSPAFKPYLNDSLIGDGLD